MSFHWIFFCSNFIKNWIKTK